MTIISKPIIEPIPTYTMKSAISRVFLLLVVTFFAAKNNALETPTPGGLGLIASLQQGARNLYDSSSVALIRSASMLRQESSSA